MYKRQGSQVVNNVSSKKLTYAHVAKNDKNQHVTDKREKSHDGHVTKQPVNQKINFNELADAITKSTTLRKILNEEIHIKNDKVQIIHGDLFTCDKNTSLAHCVSQCFSMNKGIASKFREKFNCVNTLRNQSKSVGEVAYLSYPNRNIYYLITKKNVREKPTYTSIICALLSLKLLCKKTKETKIAMPKIGSGLDRLKWTIIFNLIKFIFRKTDIEIKIYDIEPPTRIDINIVNHDKKDSPIAEYLDQFCDDLNQEQNSEGQVNKHLLDYMDKFNSELSQNMDNNMSVIVETDELNDTERSGEIEDNTDDSDLNTVHSSAENPIINVPNFLTCRIRTGRTF